VILSLVFFTTTILFVMTDLQGQSQSMLPSEQIQIVSAAKNQLDDMTLEGGELYRFFRKNNISGQFTFDITIQGKGDVITVFLVSSTSEVIRDNNLFKDKLHALKFSDIRIPKHERVKFRHTITI
jgi:hypothetical protein